jgi:phosphohistidine phosphatase
MPDLARRLFLLRHAHSSHPDGIPDMHRPLSVRGEHEAAEMGAYLENEGLVPDLVVVSGAQRTRETWRAVPFLIENRLYEAGIQTLLSVLAQQPASCHKLMLVGHNPGMQTLAQRLVGRGSQNAVVRLRHEFPPAGLAVVAFSDVSDWADLPDHAGMLERFATPATGA